VVEGDVGDVGVVGVVVGEGFVGVLPWLGCAVPPRGFVEFSGVAVVPFDAVGAPALVIGTHGTTRGAVCCGVVAGVVPGVVAGGVVCVGVCGVEVGGVCVCGVGVCGVCAIGCVAVSSAAATARLPAEMICLSFTARPPSGFVPARLVASRVPRCKLGAGLMWRISCVAITEWQRLHRPRKRTAELGSRASGQTARVVLWRRLAMGDGRRRPFYRLLTPRWPVPAPAWRRRWLLARSALGRF
jgi:hypothetical protein